MNTPYAFLGTLALALSLALPTSASAANASLYIEQKSLQNTFGEWVVTYPGSSDFTSKLRTKILSNLEAGTYRLAVRPPANAYTHISLYENGVKKSETDMTYMDITVKDGTEYRATISYTYKGTVEVFSDPSGVEFEMVSTNGDTFTGVTPMTYTDMPAIGYRVTYGLEAACEAKKSQQRALYEGSKLTFYANIDCGSTRIPTSGKTAKPLGNTQAPKPQKTEAAHADMPAQRVLQTSSMSEMVAGGRTTITLSVRNISRETLNNVYVTDTFDPSMIEIATPLADAGEVNGSLLEWHVGKIYAGQTWTTSFDIVAKDHLKTGDRIVLHAHATSDEVDANLYPDAWSSVTGIGVAYMPQTGGKYDIFFALLALVGATFITQLTIRTKKA